MPRGSQLGSLHIWELGDLRFHPGLLQVQARSTKVEFQFNLQVFTAEIESANDEAIAIFYEGLCILV